MKFVELNNGVKMPILGFGTYQIPSEEVEKAVSEAIEVGYRSFDTAARYNTERGLGLAMQKSGVSRKDFFITTKVWLDNYSYDKCRHYIDQALENLQTDYLDLVLIHQPFGDYYAAYRALEEAYQAGKIRAIGVSNFAPFRLVDMCLFGREVIPAINQVEVNPLNQRVEEQEIMQKYNVQMEAWAPFGEGKNGMFENVVLREIGRKHGKSVAQVILRWLVQREVVVICKSTHQERMRENFEIFDFELDNEDTQKIRELDTGETLFFNPQTVETVEKFNQKMQERKW